MISYVRLTGLRKLTLYVNVKKGSCVYCASPNCVIRQINIKTGYNLTRNPLLKPKM